MLAVTLNEICGIAVSIYSVFCDFVVSIYTVIYGFAVPFYSLFLGFDMPNSCQHSLQNIHTITDLRPWFPGFHYTLTYSTSLHVDKGT